MQNVSISKTKKKKKAYVKQMSSDKLQRNVLDSLHTMEYPPSFHRTYISFFLFDRSVGCPPSSSPSSVLLSSTSFSSSDVVSSLLFVFLPLFLLLRSVAVVWVGSFFSWRGVVVVTWACHDAQDPHEQEKEEGGRKEKEEEEGGGGGGAAIRTMHSVHSLTSLCGTQS